MKNTKKMVALLLAMMLLVGGVIGGTVAYLITQTGTVNNTFTSSDVSITLTETGMDADNKQSFQMVPGKVITKEAYVTVSADSEDCYLFIKVEKSDNFDTYMECAVAGGWTALAEVPGVYYMVIDTANEKNVPLYILADNRVTVKSTVTKSMMETAKNANPVMKFTAYAIQHNYLGEANSTPYGAWLLINNTANQ